MPLPVTITPADVQAAFPLFANLPASDITAAVDTAAAMLTGALCRPTTAADHDALIVALTAQTGHVLNHGGLLEYTPGTVIKLAGAELLAPARIAPLALTALQHASLLTPVVR